MIKDQNNTKRSVMLQSLSAGLVIAGGGLSGVCAAITAARAGVEVVLIQDRPVLGGNSSSEIRLWILGATAHMGNNNRWAREGGVIDEILIENNYQNPEGNAVILDMIILDMVRKEPLIKLLLNTAVYDLCKKSDDTIDFLKAFCSQNSTEYHVSAPLFCDASGDGIVGFLAGAAFRMGAESREEFDEKMAPSAEYGELLGHSIYFYSKDTGKPVKFTPPSFALDDISKIPRYKSFNVTEFGCKLWWVEYGGRLDTVHQTEEIKWELWKIVYGVWNHIKNSGEFPEAENLTLEWVGTIPGKRESRRFEGDYMMNQRDIIEQKKHDDAVAFGGWSIDLHPSDGIYSELPGCNQWHSKGIFSIPFRSLYSVNIKNLFIAGRAISVTHVAFGATRVMATTAYVGQAAGMAAALCLKNDLTPRRLWSEGYIPQLQNELMKTGQHIPGLHLIDENDLSHQAKISASSQYDFQGFHHADIWLPLEIPSGMLIPLKEGKVPAFNLWVDAVLPATLQCELMASSRPGNFTPDLLLAAISVSVNGRSCIDLQFDAALTSPQYVFVIFRKNENIKLGYSNKRITGILSVFNLVNRSVSNFGRQEPPPDTGVDTFEFWCPQRRPEGLNIAMGFSGYQGVFNVENIRNGVDRPVLGPNAWVADPDDQDPWFQLEWDSQKTIKTIEICFDTDFDHPLESVLLHHPERGMPFCIRQYHIFDDQDKEIFFKNENHQTRNQIKFEIPVITRKLKFYVQHPFDNIPAALFSVRCYSF